ERAAPQLGDQPEATTDDDPGLRGLEAHFAHPKPTDGGGDIDARSRRSYDSLVLVAIAVLLVLSPRAPSTAQEIRLDERAPLPMIVLTPQTTGAAATWPPAEDLYRTADVALRARTSLRIRSPEQVGLDVAQIAACELKERLACWTRA